MILRVIFFGKKKVLFFNIKLVFIILHKRLSDICKNYESIGKIIRRKIAEGKSY